METTRRSNTIAAVSAGALLTLALTAGPAIAERSATAQQDPCAYTPSAQQARQSSIDERYQSDPALRERLGAPTAAEVVDGTVHYREYERGRLYWSRPSGVRAIYSHDTDILGTYLSHGGHTTLGPPITDQCPAEDGGVYNHFATFDSAGNRDHVSSAYWHPDHGTHLVDQPIHEHWEHAGWEAGIYGYPTTDTAQVADGYGFFNDFTGDDGLGASIYSGPDTGTHGVKGLIREYWLDHGGTSGAFGYPTSDEYDVPTGIRSDFEGSGYITWNAETGEVEGHP